MKGEIKRLSSDFWLSCVEGLPSVAASYPSLPPSLPALLCASCFQGARSLPVTLMHGARERSGAH